MCPSASAGRFWIAPVSSCDKGNHVPARRLHRLSRGGPHVAGGDEQDEVADHLERPPVGRSSYSRPPMSDRCHRTLIHSKKKLNVFYCSSMYHHPWLTPCWNRLFISRVSEKYRVRGWCTLQLIIKFQYLRPVGGRVGLPYVIHGKINCM
jgi:hypothetical protein